MYQVCTSTFGNRVQVQMQSSICLAGHQQQRGVERLYGGHGTKGALLCQLSLSTHNAHGGGQHMATIDYA